jgi:hypothetical protein
VAYKFETTHTLLLRLFVLNSGIELVDVPVTLRLPERVHRVEVRIGIG